MYGFARYGTAWLITCWLLLPVVRRRARQALNARDTCCWAAGWLGPQQLLIAYLDSCTWCYLVWCILICCFFGGHKEAPYQDARHYRQQQRVMLLKPVQPAYLLMIKSMWEGLLTCSIVGPAAMECRTCLGGVIAMPLWCLSKFL
jgi:hypothetical protein